MWWQYLIVAIVVGGCALYLLRGLFLVVMGRRVSACGGCDCSAPRDDARRNLGVRRELLQVGVDGRKDEPGA
ncbi:MAG TPA: hypothetical protein P5081_08985 [Phycisphaerae bacterium]|nr:hypothetical protein [Phycisphaerae bacterium]HRW53010.1 hypothetical protein [Phycisphaerae bacterium]